MLNRRPIEGFLYALRITAFLVTALLLCAVAAAAQSKEKPRYGGTVRIGALSRPTVFNPLVTQEGVSSNINQILFNGLVSFNESWRAVPDLATSWAVSSDGKTWTFHLRKGVKFHDGVELTSRDVLFTYEKAVDPKTHFSLASDYAIVSRFEAPDAYTFKVVLKEAYGGFLYLMTLGILPAHVFEDQGVTMEEFGRHPIGTGPFAFSSMNDNSVTLTAFDDYFGGRPYLDKVVIKSYETSTSEWAGLLKGEVDLVDDLTYDDYLVIKNDKRFATFNYLDPFYYTLLFNLKDPLLKNRELREAISLAIDRKDLIDTALNGWGEPTTGPFQPGTWPYNPDPSLQHYDLRASERILDSLGWKDTNGDGIRDKDGKPLEFSVVIDAGDTVKERTVKRLRFQLLKAGIQLNVEVASQNAFFTQYLFPGDFQTAILQFTVAADPDRNVSIFWQSSAIGTTNLARYSDPKVDSLIAEARKTVDRDRQGTIYHEIHRLISNDTPAAFLFFRRRFLAVSTKFDVDEITPWGYYLSVEGWHLK